MYTDIDTFKSRLKAVNGITVEVGSGEESLANQVLEDAYNQIKSVLISRGLPLDRIDEFAEGQNYQLRQAIYLFGKFYGWDRRSEEEENWLNNFNCIDELKEKAIMLSDGTIAVSASKSGIAIVGTEQDDEYYEYGY